MSIVHGNTDNLLMALQDDHLTKAYLKIGKQIYAVVDSHALVEPLSNGQPARFMIAGDYDLTRRWSWRVYCGPIPRGHRIYAVCPEQNCIEATHLIAYKAERIVRPRVLVPVSA